MIDHKFTIVKKWSMVRGTVVALLALAAVAAGLAFDHLGARAFWLDEAAVANLIRHPFSELWALAAADYHPIFYIYAIKFWSMLAGESELALRSFSAIWAVALVILMYRFGVDIFRSRRVGYLAAILAATNYFVVWFATQTRPYTMAAVLGLCSYYYFFRALASPARKFLLAYAVVTALAIYTHPWLSLVFATQFFVLAIHARHQIRNYWKFFLCQVSVLIFSIPHTAVMLGFEKKLDATNWVGPLSPGTLWESAKYLSFGSSWLYLAFVFLALLFWGLRKAPPAPLPAAAPTASIKNSKIYLTLGLYLVFPMLAGLAISSVKLFYVPGRYEMVVLPAFLLLLAGLFAHIKKPAVLAIFAVLALGLTFRQVIADRKVVASYRSTDQMIARDILQNLADGDLVVASYLSYPTMDYYLPRLNRTFQKQYQFFVYPENTRKHPALLYNDDVANSRESYRQEAQDFAQTLKTVRATATNRIWVITAPHLPLNAILLEALEREFETAKTITPPEPREPSWISEVRIFK